MYMARALAQAPVFFALQYHLYLIRSYVFSTRCIAPFTGSFNNSHHDLTSICPPLDGMETLRKRGVNSIDQHQSLSPPPPQACYERLHWSLCENFSEGERPRCGPVSRSL